MDLWLLKDMPDEKEGEPREGHKHEAQRDLFAEVVLGAQVPIEVRFDILPSETHADREEKYGNEG